MDAMVNLMREHSPDRARIRHTVTKGDETFPVAAGRGRDPVFRPAHRSFGADRGDGLGEAGGRQRRLWRANRVEFDEDRRHPRRLLPNTTLMQVMDRNLQQVGGIT